MTSNLLDKQLDDLLRELIDDADEELLVVNPAPGTIETFVDVAIKFEGDLPSIQMLAEERTLKDVMDDFIVASNTADLVDLDVLSLRTVESPPRNSLLVTDESVVALIDAGSQVAGLVSEDEEFVDQAVETYRDRWDAADEFNLRTPPITRVRNTLEDEIGPDAEADFSNILDSLETARGDGDGLDEVTISLLVAAKNEALLYDISKWGEDVGIASKATFSRTKTKLEDMGLIDTEKVPIDVGRPRLRLKFGDDRLRDADNDQLATTAQSILN
ncbi:transcriptional regulator TbsP [Natronoarchaeum sp. GCM10025703]|uniref:transcriptional regulator TbsP n=1 Tax=unclassified Natronoarchaeum TaxID=2620183 RepID=UPI00360DA5F9